MSIFLLIRINNTDTLHLMENIPSILIINSSEKPEVLTALSSRARVEILNLLTRKQLNINEIAQELSMPQSTIATNVALLEKTGLVETEMINAKKGSQKMCRAAYQEILIQFSPKVKKDDDTIEVEMPIGLFTQYQVSAPCGLCSPESIIGYLDVPASFLNPDRMKAGLIWFETGWIEYQYPNNAMYTDRPIRALEISAELSSETPGTNDSWLSDITMWINNTEIGQWTSPGDFGDKRGKLTPDWWKLEGSQYGLLKKWSVTRNGTFVDGVQISNVALSDIHLTEHHSIRVKIGVKSDAKHPGGINIFGRGFGNHNQAILLRMYFEDSPVH